MQQREAIEQTTGFILWEWADAPEWARKESPMYDDVDFIAILPRGMEDVPFWLDNINGCGGGNNWAKRLPSGRVIVAICHS